MKIYILGHHCRICDAVEELVWNVVEENEIAATIKRVVKDVNIVKFGGVITPAVVVGNEIKVMGRKPRKEEVLSWIMAETLAEVKQLYLKRGLDDFAMRDILEVHLGRKPECEYLVLYDEREPRKEALKGQFGIDFESGEVGLVD